MGVFKRVTRSAEGMTVSIGEPAPRWVTITREGYPGGFHSLSIANAEGLLYALQHALADARADDIK